jgi:hypothetical protein
MANTKARNPRGQATSTNSPIQLVIGGLRNRGCDPKEGNAGEWRSKCPVHKGKASNLSVKEGADGTVVLHCHHADAAGKTCPADAIVEAIGLELKDLFVPKTSSRPKKPPPGPTTNGKRGFGSAADAIAWLTKTIGTHGGEWVYKEPTGGFELMRVIRLNESDGGKQFRPIYPHANGWFVGDPPGKLPLYNQPDLAGAPVVIVLEGEKICDLAKRIGLTTTTSSHGSESPGRTDWGLLAGKNLVLIPDHDKPGEGYMNAVAAIVAKLDPKPNIKIVHLPLSNEGDDFEQWLDQVPDSWGPEECRQEIERLAAAAPEWAPSLDAPSRPDLDEETAKLLENYRPKTFGQIVKSVGELVHLWLNWLIIGNLSMVYSKPKVGKTRVYIRLMKTLWFGEKWADGANNPWPAGTKTVILPYDRNHQEIAAEMARQGIPDDAAICPHDPRDATGVSLLNLTDPLMLAILDRTLSQDKAVKLIVVDTLTYASDKSLSKPEDMKEILDSIMTLAVRFAVAVLILIHENKDGKALGRRICERARVLMKLERYSESDPKRLRFYVEESNFPERPALTVIHTDQGIDFEKDQGASGNTSDRRDTCARWLAEYLLERSRQGQTETDYGTLICAAGDAGFAGVFNPVENRWSDRQLLNRAIKGINDRAGSLKDLHEYTITREERMKFGRSKPVILFRIECQEPPATIPMGAPY